jgi:hypothetical protein
MDGLWEHLIGMSLFVPSRRFFVTAVLEKTSSTAVPQDDTIRIDWLEFPTLSITFT